MSRGFNLLTAMMLVLLMITFSLFLHLRIRTRWRLAANVESQLYSMVLAENGIEYARTLLPHLELDSLLAGADGTYSGGSSPEWRSPMSFAESRRVDPSTWLPPDDDGLPTYQGQQLLPQGYHAEGRGHFFLKFSNNPEEDPEHDEDQIVLVRSMGIVPGQVQNPLFPNVKNSVALLEARFRQERAFSLPSPLTLFGDSGAFQWEGESFMVEGGQEFAISLVSPSPSTLLQDLMGSLSGSQQQSIQGLGGTPSIRDASPLYLTEQIYRGLFNSEYWDHFLTQVPGFTDQPMKGIAFWPDGGVLDSPFSGILIARRDLILRDRAQIQGLLLHLGGGRLTLRDRAEVIGGVWMSNHDSTGDNLKAGQLSLHVTGSSTIRYDRAAIRKALSLLPPTQLGWRVLLPETVE